MRISRKKIIKGTLLREAKNAFPEPLDPDYVTPPYTAMLASVPYQTNYERWRADIKSTIKQLINSEELEVRDGNYYFVRVNITEWAIGFIETLKLVLTSTETPRDFTSWGRAAMLHALLHENATEAREPLDDYVLNLRKRLEHAERLQQNYDILRRQAHLAFNSLEKSVAKEYIRDFL